MKSEWNSIEVVYFPLMQLQVVDWAKIHQCFNINAFINLHIYYMYIMMMYNYNQKIDSDELNVDYWTANGNGNEKCMEYLTGVISAD